MFGLDFVKKAQELQSNLAKAKEEISRLTVTGESGAGQIRATMNGRFELLSLSIDPAILSSDPGRISDLVVMAVNDAGQKVRTESTRIMGDATGMGPGNPLSAMGLPGF